MKKILREYQLDGQFHRVDGPAIEFTDGSKEWYQHGQLHRTDGPACEWVNGYKTWWLDGIQLTEEQWKIKINADKIMPIQMTKDTFNNMFGRFSDACEKYVSVDLLLDFIEEHDTQDPDFKEDLLKFIIRTSKCYKGRSV